MVQNRNADKAASGRQLFRYIPVVPLGRGVTGWVVVNEDDGRRALRDGRAKYLSRMNYGRIQSAARDGNLANHRVLRVQKQDPELLLPKVTKRWRTEIIHISRSLDTSSFGRRFARHAPAKLERGQHT